MKETGEYVPKIELKKKKISKPKEEKTKTAKTEVVNKKKKLNEKVKKTKKEKNNESDSKKEEKKEKKQKKDTKIVENDQLKGNNYGMDHMHPSWLAKQQEKESGFVSISKKSSKVKVIDL